jgi:hypothetical protein
MTNIEKLHKAIIAFWTNPSLNRTKENLAGWKASKEEIAKDIKEGLQLGFKTNGINYIYHNKGKV